MWPSPLTRTSESVCVCNSNDVCQAASLMAQRRRRFKSWEPEPTPSSHTVLSIWQQQQHPANGQLEYTHHYSSCPPHHHHHHLWKKDLALMEDACTCRLPRPPSSHSPPPPLSSFEFNGSVQQHQSILFPPSPLELHIQWELIGSGG